MEEPLNLEGMRLEEQLHGDREDNPEAIVIAKEDQKKMEERLDLILSPLERNALFYYLSGCNYDEIGRHLNTTAKTVDNALQRVRRKLKQNN